MACFDENTLIDIARGRASVAVLSEVERHVSTCDDCARVMAAVADVVTLAGLARGGAGGSRAGPGVGGGRPGELPPGTVLNGTYHIVRLIGRGGMGEVYEASHARLQGRYAVKILSPDVAGTAAVISRFKREAELTSGLRHPNIIHVLDFDQTPEGRAFLAMEYLEGRHLGEVIQTEGPLALARVLEIVTPVVSALASIHDHQIVHRDLKPQNIMLVRGPDYERDGAEVVKLLDFGLSKRWGGAGADSMLVSKDRILLGTPMYMAPEQARGEAFTVGPAADQFALGAIVYEMLTQRPPFSADSIHAVLYRIVYADPAPLRGLRPDIPAGVEVAVRRALAKEAADRFPSVRELLEALRDPGPAEADEPTPGTTAGESPRAPSSARSGRRRPFAVAAAAVIALLGGAAVWRVRPAGHGTPSAANVRPQTETAAPFVAAVPADAATAKATTTTVAPLPAGAAADDTARIAPAAAPAPAAPPKPAAARGARRPKPGTAAAKPPEEAPAPVKPGPVKPGIDLFDHL